MARARVEVAAPRWPAAVWRALVAALDDFPPRTRERGQRYARQGHVQEIEVFDDSVVAMVVGSDLYEVTWEHEGGRWHALCTCPVGSECKHAYAVGRCLVDEIAPDQQAARPASRAAGHAVAPRVPVATQPSHLRAAALENLRAGRDFWTRQAAITQLLAGRTVPAPARDPWAYRELLDEPDPDVLCWRLAQAVAALAGGWLPQELETFRNRRDLAARLGERRRAELLRDVLAWAGRFGRTPQRRLRVVLTLARAATGEVVVHVEARATSARVTDAPRSSYQLQQLRAEVLRDPSLLPADQAALLLWLTEHGMGGNEPYLAGDPRRMAGLPALLERLAHSSLGAWSETLPQDLAALGGVAPGDPVRLSAEPALLAPTCTSDDGATRLAFCFLWPDGRTCGLDEALYLPRQEGYGPTTSLVLRRGVFSPVASAPPADLVARVRDTGGLALEPSERLAVLRRLAAGFPHLQATLRAHARVHAVTPTLALDLRDDDRLHVRAFAHTGGWQPGRPLEAGGLVFELAPDEGWRRLQGAAGEEDYAALALGGASAPGGDPDERPAPASQPRPDTEDDAWSDEPDPDAVAPATAWLEQLWTALGGRRTLTAEHGGWCLPVPRRRMDALAAVCAERPAGVAVYGTERLRRLLDGSRRLSPRLRIEASGIDWFTVAAEWQAEGRELTEADIAALRTATTRFVRLPGGWVDREVVTTHDQAAAVLADLGIEAGGGPQRLTPWQLASARPESLDTLARLGVDPETLAAVTELRRRIAEFRGLPAVPPPRGLVGMLRPYQQHGLDFLAHSAALGVGAILADDMGLGKTVQALAWLAHLRAAEPGGGPSLVVCPASVVHNWAREAERFVPSLRVLLLTRGSARHALRAAAAEHDLVVTNYALLRRDVEAWGAVPLRALILDEAQNVKNPDAAVTRAVQGLTARHRVALTGTPLENRPLDLWSIMNVVNPGYLGSRASFTARYDHVDVPPHRHALLAARLRPVVLRRLKRDVAPELPERIEERRDCELTAGQRRLYLAELKRSRLLLEQLGAESDGLERHRIQVLAALTRLRQICCHPALAGGARGLGSGKFDALFEVLEPLLAEGHKVLVFSQFVKCLHLLADELRARAIPQHILTGATVRREAVVRAFTDDEEPSVFLVSLKAGGTGLNLTAASYVVLFDPWWNPAVEAQAIDRTHRIGQDRTVIAYRLVARGTVEERIRALQERKAALARDVLGEGGFGRALTRDDLAYLLAGEEA